MAPTTGARRASAETDQLSKLERHAQKFRECAAPGAVLKKYVAKAAIMSVQDLQRHICHVCAWIALAHPPIVAAKRTGVHNLSPVRVLCSMLRLLGRMRLTDRLWAALRAVKSRVINVLESVATQDMEHITDWQELHNELPILRMRKCGIVKTLKKDPSELIEVETDTDVAMFKRLRRLNLSICSWRARSLVEQELLIADLEQRLLGVEPSGDTLLLRILLYDVIGALAPPRNLTCGVRTEELKHREIVERTKEIVATQTRVRCILLKALTKWRCDFNLEDVQIEPILRHIRNYIHDFEEAHGDLRQVCSAKQWQALKVLIGVNGDYYMLQAAAARALKESRRSVSFLEGRAKAGRIVNRVWEPSDRVRGLPSCVHYPEFAKEIACSRCGYVVLSAWFFVHPRTREKFVLVPQMGHSACKLGPRKQAPYLTKDGSPYKKDLVSNIDYCAHERLRMECRTCGNRQLCEHGHRVTRCVRCAHLVKRRKLK